MRDRLAEFRKKEDESHGHEGGRTTVVDLQQDITPPENEVISYLKKALECRTKITHIEGLIKNIKELHSVIHGTASRNEDKHKQLNSAMDEIRKLFDTIKQILKEMDQQASKLKDDSTAQTRRPADIRIMLSQFEILQCWFFDAWTEYNECQSNYREKCKEKLTRQIQITEKEVTPEEINNMIESGNFTVFSWNAQFQQKDIEELESRHSDIAKLAESLKALHEMFKDLALMVEQQGEMLNNIEKNIEQAQEYVVHAERETQHALDHTIALRKKKLICMLVVVIVLVVVATVIGIVIYIQTK